MRAPKTENGVTLQLYSSPALQAPAKVEHMRDLPTTKSRSVPGYQRWRTLAVELAQLPVTQLLEKLESEDPFQVRGFEQALLERETTLKRTLTHEELVQLFPCPVQTSADTVQSTRLTLPDQRPNDKAAAFRSMQPGYFLFFQHLRKAGGTHFCSLAQANLPKEAIAQYYCMPDYRWSEWKGAGYLHHWNSTEIARRMRESGHRIAGNEWDFFDPDHHFDLPAVFATSFRRPLDRALSQFRFECIEDRGCHIKNVTEWWEHRKDLYNIYTLTFADPPHVFRKLRETYLDAADPEQAQKRGELLGRALDTVAKFNLVLAMEWLAYAGPPVSQVLGFSNTSVLTHRVRPHITQYERNDGQDVNKLGAASITKASWDPKEYLSATQYKHMSELLALDSILTDAARRMFLERLTCGEKR